MHYEARCENKNKNLSTVQKDKITKKCHLIIWLFCETEKTHRFNVMMFFVFKYLLKFYNMEHLEV